MILSNYNRAHSVVTVPALIEALGQGLSMARTAKLLGYHDRHGLREYMRRRSVCRYIERGVIVIQVRTAPARGVA